MSINYKKNKTSEIVFYLLFFFSTLRITSPLGIYFLSIIVPLISAFIYIYHNNKNIKISYCGVLLSLSVVVSWLGVYIKPFYSYVVVNDKQYMLIICLIILFSTILKNIIKEIDKAGMLRAISFTIYFHIVTFVIQYSLWHSFKIDFDYGLITGGSAHRAFYYGGLYRTTGIFEEPSIYSGYMMALLSMRYYLSGRNSMASYFGIATMVLSYSTVGVFLSFLYLLITNLRFNFLQITFLSLASIISAVISSEYLIDRFDLILSGGDGSTNTKLFVINSYFTDLYNLMFGFGMVYKEKIENNIFDGLGDLGVIFNSFMIFGFSFGVMITFVLCKKFVEIMSLRSSALIITSLIKMASFHHPFFWVLFFTYIYIEKNSNEGCLNEK